MERDWGSARGAHRDGTAMDGQQSIAIWGLTLKTSHLNEMVRWYEARGPISRSRGGWTTNDEGNHRIAFLAVPGLSDNAGKTRHNGMHHCSTASKI